MHYPALPFWQCAESHANGDIRTQRRHSALTATFGPNGDIRTPRLIESGGPVVLVDRCPEALIDDRVRHRDIAQVGGQLTHDGQDQRLLLFRVTRLRRQLGAASVGCDGLSVGRTGDDAAGEGVGFVVVHAAIVQDSGGVVQ